MRIQIGEAARMVISLVYISCIGLAIYWLIHNKTKSYRDLDEAEQDFSNHTIRDRMPVNYLNKKNRKKKSADEGILNYKKFKDSMRKVEEQSALIESVEQRTN